MTGSVETYQLSVEAAEVYEARFVPAIFAEWAPHLVEAAGVVGGQAVLDVACGTGVVARTAADRMAGRGRVVGLDLNEGMLAVARRLTGTRTRVGVVRFDSAEEAVATEIQATPLAERIDPDAYRRILEAGVEAMRPFVVDGGRVELPIQGHLVTGAKAG
jgi:SAM-dependent methyltransferase